MTRYLATLLFGFSAMALGAAADISKVNGSIDVAAGREAGDAKTVNGSITIGSDARVRDVETVNGDVFVGTGSRVDGGIRVEKPGARSWRKSERLPRITIESGAEVNGTLRFEREVDLYVGAGAVIGPVEGVPPRRHELQ